MNVLKTIHNIFPVLLVGFLTSCAHTPMKPSVVGTWLHESKEGVFTTKVVLSFDADGLYSSRVDYYNPEQVSGKGVNGGTVTTTFLGTHDWDEAQGTYTLKDNEIVISSRKTASSHSSPEERLKVEIFSYSLEGNILTISDNSSALNLTFERVHPPN